MMARPTWRVIALLCSVLLSGVLLGYRLSESSNYYHGSSSYDTAASKRNSNLGPFTSFVAVSHVGSESHPNATGSGGEGASPPSCQRLWRKGRSAWFDEKFAENLLPVWVKQNMKLPDEISTWWTGLQSNKDKDYVTELKKAFEVIPSPDRFLTRNLSTCMRCAVVGNSGNLKGSGYGSLIDNYDAVIRINQAKTKGFEADVGKKETHRLMYPESFMDIPKDTNFVLLSFKLVDIQWVRSALTTGEIKRTYTSVRSKIPVPPSKVLFYNPALMWHIHRQWIDRKGRYPSSGTLAVFFGLQFCDEVSVFGMGANSKGYWDHYWQTGDGSGNSAFLKTHVHDSVHELNVIKRLAEEKIITFYEGVR